MSEIMIFFGLKFSQLNADKTARASTDHSCCSKREECDLGEFYIQVRRDLWERGGAAKVN